MVRQVDDRHSALTLRDNQVRLRLPPQAAPADASIARSAPPCAAAPLPEGSWGLPGSGGRGVNRYLAASVVTDGRVWVSRLGGAWGAITDVALASRGIALGDAAARLVVGDHAFWHPGRLGRLQVEHGVELNRELGSKLERHQVDRRSVPKQDP